MRPNGPNRSRSAWWLGLCVCSCAAGLLLIESGCRRGGQPSDEGVLLYCSVDAEFAREVLAEYERRTGEKVRVIFDTEAAKTTGLVQRILDEAGRPGADVFWSGEIFNTILLARRGRLVAYDSPAAADIPSRYKDSEHRWTAFGARARVLAYDPALLGPDVDEPQTWESLADPFWAPRLALANPLFGTTRGHVAAMFALWGPPRARAFLQFLADHGAAVVDGNSAAVRAVAGGDRGACMTDTDDVIVARKQHPRIEMCFPDMGDGGTVVIPNTVALIAGGGQGDPARGDAARGGAARGDRARRLYDFLASADVERMLARSDSRNIPVREALRSELSMEMPPETKLTFDQITDAMDEATAAAREILLK
ncbi:MAG: extracellular solute-binding protein [Phycisphaerales bacterium]|nr:extracellular solute-binding protein [Phycisphaerales bacterium]